ncbi:MAG TPA: hypothetical protein VE954_09775 [Oligoflexus sp.]|uniref:hypothetical protein n=1 Tax=Oligoflexus sp. TaxID=1971216 RepID=UPI002D46FDEC|nr:hypothetical protein [Oligoflexus sp.]HYX33390.1 hypothetical protein [Oligoflexus sp.]
MLTSIFKRLCLMALILSSCGGPQGDGETLAPLALENLSLPELNNGAGIYPSQAVLEDSQNPFTRAAVSPANRWNITGWAMEAGAPATRLSAMFYAWATELAIARSGESQFQTAIALRTLSAHETLSEDQRTLYRNAAIQAYQSMLDNFKDSVGYTAEGYSYRLVPLAFYAIRDLGGTPQGRWVETVDPYGNKIVVEI